MSTEKNAETVETNQQTVEEKEMELIKRFPSVTRNPIKQFFLVLLQTAVVVLLVALVVSSLIREYSIRDNQILESKEYTGTVVEKYAAAGLTDSLNYVIEIKTVEDNNYIIYISKELWDTIEKGRDYKLTISETKLREGKVSLELIKNGSEEESGTQEEESTTEN